MKFTHCQWIGEGERCDKPVLEGKSYCEEHQARVYQSGSALSKRKKDIRVADEVRTWESLINEAVAELEAEGAI